jgi:3-hydroxybutyrate dehydrogenase
MKLQGKSALVTGAASGIGKEIALACAREGARVAIANLRLDAAEGTAEQIRRDGSLTYIGSVHSQEASLRKAPYEAAKHGLVGLSPTKALTGQSPIASHG